MITLLLTAILLHPGHSTRLEVRLSDDAKRLEVAMRLDSIDLESALKARLKKPFDPLQTSDEDAKQLVGEYLRDTLTIDGEKLDAKQFHWVGWQKQPRHVWVFFELPIRKTYQNPLKLQIRSLFEVEPELRHIVVLDKNVGDRSLVLTTPDQTLEVELGTK